MGSDRRASRASTGNVKGTAHRRLHIEVEVDVPYYITDKELSTAIDQFFSEHCDHINIIAMEEAQE